jgi:hypothetical protein
MRLRNLRHVPSAAAPVLEPSSHIRLLHTGPLRTDLPSDSPYVIEDGLGVRHEIDAETRRDALRAMSHLCLRGTPLPLLLLDPEGLPTGDRIG